MRQAHGLAFGKSDMFFVVALELEEGEQQLVAQEDEIEAVAWQPISEFSANPFMLERPLLRKIMERCVAYSKGQYVGLEGAKIASGFSDREDLLLFGEGGGGASGVEGTGPEEDAWIGLS